MPIYVFNNGQPKFPDGKLSKDDEGELTIAITEQGSCIRIDFGKDISWIALQPEQAREIGTRLLQFAKSDEETYEG